MCTAGADVLILAGDIATGGEETYREFLNLFRRFGGPKLFVPGNHDLWSAARKPRSRQRYREDLPALVHACGFHYLPGQPLAVNGTGFVGTIGWYDYGFRQIEPPRAGLCVTPMHPVGGPGQMRLEPRRGRLDVAWQDLTDADYAHKALAWSERGRPRSLIWNDAVFVDWGRPDPVVADEMATELARDMAALGPDVRALVCITHCLPFAGLLDGPTRDVGHAFCRAYMGSPRVGETVRADRRSRLVLCGHWHRQNRMRVGALEVVNCSVGDRAGPPLIIELDRDEPA